MVMFIINNNIFKGFPSLFYFSTTICLVFRWFLKFSFLCQASPSEKKTPSKDKQTQQHFKTLKRWIKKMTKPSNISIQTYINFFITMTKYNYITLYQMNYWHNNMYMYLHFIQYCVICYNFNIFKCFKIRYFIINICMVKFDDLNCLRARDKPLDYIYEVCFCLQRETANLKSLSTNRNICL